MDVYYEEKTGGATFAAGEVKLPFSARRLWLRHVAGAGVAEVSLTGDFTETHVKLEPLAAGLQGTHPHEVEIVASSGKGISKLAIKPATETVAIRATS